MLSGENALSGVANLSSDGFAALSDLFVEKVGSFLHSGRIFSAHLDQRFHNPTLWV